MTNQKSDENSFLGAMYDMMDGTTTSDCALPCETISMQTKIETEMPQYPFTHVEISFNSKVRTTTTDPPANDEQFSV